MGNENGEIQDMVNKFTKGGEGEKVDIFDAIEEIMNDPVALGFVSSKVHMDNEQVKNIVSPFLGIMKTQGVQMFSAGDESRAAQIQGGLDTVNSYAAVVKTFWPLFKMIYENIRQGRKDTTLADEDWDGMMFNEQPQPQAQPQQGGQPPQPKSGADFLKRPTPNAFSSTSNTPPPKKSGGNTAMKAIIENHRKKYGDSGLDKVLVELKEKGIDVDVEIKKEGAPAPSSIKGMTMNDMVNKFHSKYGNDQGTGRDEAGWNKVKSEMESAGLSTGVEEVATPPQSQSRGDARELDFGQDEEVPVKIEQPVQKKFRVDDMPRLSGMTDPFGDDE